MNLGNLSEAVWGIISVGILCVFALMFLSQANVNIAGMNTAHNQSDPSTWSAAYNATESTVTAIGTVPDWFTLLIVMVIFMIFIALFFAWRGRTRGPS